MQLYYSSRGIVQICSAQLTHQLVKTLKFTGIYIKLFKFFTAQYSNIKIKLMSTKGLLSGCKNSVEAKHRETLQFLCFLWFSLESIRLTVRSIELTLQFKNHVLTDAQLRFKKQKTINKKINTKTGKKQIRIKDKQTKKREHPP